MKKITEKIVVWTTGWIGPVVFLVLVLLAIAAIAVVAVIVNFKDVRMILVPAESIRAALITAIPAIALFLAAYIQLRRNARNQRVAFVSQYVSRIFTDQELSDTFHYLIYTYSNDRFCRVKMKLKDDGITRESCHGHETTHEAMYASLYSLQDGRKKGFRFYHPDFFQRSVEEKRLDSLLGYFNIIAYYVRKGLLDRKDIDGSIGYHLTVMGTRDVIAEYMKIIEEEWNKEGRYARQFGMGQPFRDLKWLLDELRKRRRSS